MPINAERPIAAQKDLSFKFRKVGALELKPPEWGIKGLYENNALVVLFGRTGDCKSFLSVDIACSVATGTPWHGRAVKKPGVVIYLAGEGHEGLSRRFKAWALHNGVPLDDAPLFLSDLPANLNDEENIKQVEASIKAIADEHGAPSLIVLDTWNRNLGGDENSSLDSTRGVAAVDYLRHPYGATALVVHHQGWSADRTRGSSVLKASADLELHLERDELGIIRMDATKVKDNGPDGGIAFMLQDIDLGILDDEGQPVIKATIVEVPYSEPVPKQGATAKSSRKALEQLKSLESLQAMNLEDAGIAGAIWVKNADWQDTCKDAGISKTSFYRARTTLIDTGEIVVQGCMVQSQSIPKIVPKHSHCIPNMKTGSNSPKSHFPTPLIGVGNGTGNEPEKEKPTEEECSVLLGGTKTVTTTEPEAVQQTTKEEAMPTDAKKIIPYCPVPCDDILNLCRTCTQNLTCSDGGRRHTQCEKWVNKYTIEDKAPAPQPELQAAEPTAKPEQPGYLERLAEDMEKPIVIGKPAKSLADILQEQRLAYQETATDLF